MPHSLRAKLKYLTICGHIRKKDYERLCKALDNEGVLDKIKAEIEQVKAVMNEEIVDHNRKDLINFVNGLNQSLNIIDKYKADTKYAVKIVAHGNCMNCGKELTEGIFFCKECMKKAEGEE